VVVDPITLEVFVTSFFSDAVKVIAPTFASHQCWRG